MITSLALITLFSLLIGAVSWRFGRLLLALFCCCIALESVLMAVLWYAFT